MRYDMEHKSKDWTPEDLLNLLSDLPESGVALPLLVSGSSMVPFLVHGRDTVYLSKITTSIKRGDIVLYRRNNGELVLHRVCRLTSEGLTMIGDAQQDPESGIGADQLLAVTTAVRRKGKLLTRSDWRWKCFGRIWLLVIPWRRKLLSVYASITKKMVI